MTAYLNEYKSLLKWASYSMSLTCCILVISQISGMGCNTEIKCICRCLLKTLVLHHDFFPFVFQLDQLLWEPRCSLLWHKFKRGMPFSDSSPTPSLYHKHCKMASFPHSFKPYWTSLRSLPCSPQKTSEIKFWVGVQQDGYNIFL